MTVSAALNCFTNIVVHLPPLGGKDTNNNARCFGLAAVAGSTLIGLGGKFLQNVIGWPFKGSVNAGVDANLGVDGGVDGSLSVDGDVDTGAVIVIPDGSATEGVVCCVDYNPKILCCKALRKLGAEVQNDALVIPNIDDSKDDVICK